MPLPKSRPILVADKLSFCYQDQLVLADVNFQILPNEFIGVIGPNGGGKTTLLKLIMGFLQPSSGTLKVDLGGGSGKIAYVPQLVRFDRAFPISVFEVVLSGLLHALPWHGHFSEKQQCAARAALKQTRMEGYLDAAFGTLSGGQAQRVLIARALVSEPALLLLDEPTASVDPEAQVEIYDLLTELKGSVTILMVTHDLKAAVTKVERLFCVQRQLVPMKLDEVCNHFALGLYST